MPFSPRGGDPGSALLCGATVQRLLPRPLKRVLWQEMKRKKATMLEPKPVMGCVVMGTGEKITSWGGRCRWRVSLLLGEIAYFRDL